MKFYFRFLLFIILFIWTTGIFIELLIPHAEGLTFLYPFVHQSYSLACHQQPDKLITIGTAHTQTCSRCTGIYMGALLSSLILLVYPAEKKFKIEYLFIASIPIFADIILYQLKIYSYSIPVAFATGLLLGVVGFYYFYISLSEFINSKKEKITKP